MSLPKISADMPAITVNNLTVRRGANEVLEDVTFSIPQGAIAAVIGPNGSGKTTLIRAILGLLEVEHGDAAIMGSRLEHVRNLIGYVPQNFDFDRDFPMTVREFMQLAGHDHLPYGAIEAKIAEVGLAEDLLDRHLGKLSGGQLQRVLIAQAILNDPLVLFLDEPSAGVDIAGEATFHEILRHLNRHHHTTVIMVSHDVASIGNIATQIICVNQKLICSGPPAETLTAPILSEVFGPGAAAYLFDNAQRTNRENT